jgi:transcriptional activator of cad operon
MGYIWRAMDSLPPSTLRIGDWSVDPATGQMTRGEESIRVEARTLRLLLCLADSAGEVVSIDELLNKVWSGVIVTPDSVYQAVTSLRRLLGDDPKHPSYIATAPRLGYRMIAPVSLCAGQRDPPKVTAAAPAAPSAIVAAPEAVARRRALALTAAGAALGLVLIAAFIFLGKGGNDGRIAATTGAPQKSVAVLPFLDLTTEAMNEEYFADGMTEELIDKLSKIPGLRVPAPTSSFYFKGKHVPVAEIAKSLAVAYVLDGSIRKSDAALRVAVRLIRADDGYVVWSETYDRPLDDKLKVQDDIAGEVAKALRATIG